jgi:AcrR family transcriptional regulator
LNNSSAAGTRTRNRRGQGALLREDILVAATALLDETGTEEAVTLRAVARRAGITAPSIYSHFPDRQAILLAVVRDAFADLTRGLQAAEPPSGRHQPADTVARLLAVCEAYLDFAAQRPKVYRLMFGGVWNAEQAVLTGHVSTDDVTELGRDALGLLTTCLEGCVDSGASTSTDPVSDTVAAVGRSPRSGEPTHSKPTVPLAPRHPGATHHDARPPQDTEDVLTDSI